MSYEEREKTIKMNYQRRKYDTECRIDNYHLRKTAWSDPSKLEENQIKELKCLAKRANIIDIDLFINKTIKTISKLNVDEQLIQKWTKRDSEKRKLKPIVSAAKKLMDHMTDEKAPSLSLISQHLVAINEEENKPIFYADTFLDALNKVIHAYEYWEIESELQKNQNNQSDTFQIDMLASTYYSCGGTISHSENAIFPDYVRLCEKIARCEIHIDPKNHIKKIQHKYKKQ